MKPPRLSYVRPATVDEALELISAKARPLAGGQSLMPLLNLRRARPAVVIDLCAIEDLQRTYVADDGALVIGAMVTMAEIERDSALRDAVPLLARALALVGNPQVRARGTIGGSVAHRDPVSEVSTALVALQATAGVRSAHGECRRPVASLALAEDELLVDIRIPRCLLARPGAFHEVAPRFAARALAVAAAVLERADDGSPGLAHVAVGGLADAPVELEGLDRLQGGRVSESRAQEIVRAAVERVIAIDDPRADERYRREATTALATRALMEVANDRAPAPPGSRTFSLRGRAARQPFRRLEGPDLIRITVNGDVVEVPVEPRALLSDVLRERLGLYATHVGCEHGVCGACNVLLDGEAVRSCLMLAVQAEGRTIETLEGLRSSGEVQDLIEAFVEGHALQCGYCTPGFVVTLAHLRSLGAPVTAEALVGNLCRCTGYRPILAVAGAAR
jgi:CO/xanthine dehydrogenase FAD-binding subunit/aerobic-type carbon monoxide dehydrogenase small subunit (CoxS/CutS family)